MNTRASHRRLAVALALTLPFTVLALSASSEAAKPRKKKAAAKAIRACAHAKTGRLRIRVKGRKCRKGERALTWSVRGPRGPRGIRGVAGTSGSPGPGGGGAPGTPGSEASARSIFTARAGGYVAVVNPAFAAVTGPTTVTATESLVQSLAPSTGFVAGGLAVRATEAPGAGNTITVTLRDDSSDTAVACTITDAATTCASDATATVDGTSAISLKVSSTGNVPTTSLLVGFDGR